MYIFNGMQHACVSWSLFSIYNAVADTRGGGGGGGLDPSPSERIMNIIIKSRIKIINLKKAVEDRRGTFTSFVTSVDGLLHREAEHFLKHIATSIAAKWEKSYAES